MSSCHCHGLDVTVWYSSFQTPRSLAIELRDSLLAAGDGTTRTTAIAHDEKIAEYVQVSRDGEQVTSAIVGAPIYGIEATRLRSPRIVELLTKWLQGEKLTVSSESNEEKIAMFANTVVEIIE